MAYWLMKSEPEVFGIQHLREQKTALWDGVRNYQARNFIRTMQVGDTAFFYHSNCKVPGIVGLMRICTAPYPDPTQFNPEHKYFDPKSLPSNPRWTGIDVAYMEHKTSTLSLDALRQIPALHDLALVRKGNRLSLMPLTDSQYAAIYSVYSGLQ